MMDKERFNLPRLSTICARAKIPLTLLEGVQGGLVGLGGLHSWAKEVQADVNCVV